MRGLKKRHEVLKPVRFAHLLPWLLTVLRFPLAVLMVLLAVIDGPRAALLALLVIGFLSDVFDGIIARRLGIATDDLRRLDSLADTIFYLGVLIAAWILHQPLIEAAALPIALVVGLEALREVFDRLRFGRAASYHAWSAKAFGLLLFLASLSIFGWSDGRLLGVCMWWGVVSELEGLAMSCVLPSWQRDLAHFGRAWNLRKPSD